MSDKVITVIVPADRLVVLWDGTVVDRWSIAAILLKLIFVVSVSLTAIVGLHRMYDEDLTGPPSAFSSDLPVSVPGLRVSGGAELELPQNRFLLGRQP